MKREIVNSAKFFESINAGVKNRPALRTLTELAQEFGLSNQQLSALLRTTRVVRSAMPVIIFKTVGAHRNDWYDPHVMRAWWRQDQKHRLADQAKKRKTEKGSPP